MIQNEFMFCSKIVSTSLERFVTPFVTPSVNLVGCYNLPAAWRGGIHPTGYIYSL